MKKFFMSLVLTTVCASAVFAQHSDVEFGYDSLDNPTTIVVGQDLVTNEGIQFYEATIEQLGDDRFTPDPGFAADEPDEGFVVNPGDTVSLRVLDASESSLTNLGAGFVNFYDPEGDGSLQAMGEFAISTGGVPNPAPALLLNGASISPGSGDNPVFIGQADDDGDIHNHLVFDIDDDAPLGAYGFLVQLEAQLATANLNGDFTITSDPFFTILNNGLSDEVFEGPALAAFGVVESASIPEPTSGVLLAAVGSVILTRRRKRRV